MSVVNSLAKGKGRLKFYTGVTMPDGSRRCTCIVTIKCTAMEAEDISAKFVKYNDIVTHVEFCADSVLL